MPPPGWMRAMSPWIHARCFAGVMRTTRRRAVERDDLDEVVEESACPVGRGRLRHLDRNRRIEPERSSTGPSPPAARRASSRVHTDPARCARWWCGTSRKPKPASPPAKEAARRIADVALDRVLLRERHRLRGASEDDEVVALSSSRMDDGISRGERTSTSNSCAERAAEVRGARRVAPPRRDGGPAGHRDRDRGEPVVLL